MCVQFDLARAVEEDVVIAELLEALLEPPYVVLKLFNRIKHAAVGA